MTPTHLLDAKSKAQELVELFQTVVIEPSTEHLFCMGIQEAKQCALITVSEIIKVHGSFPELSHDDYWQRVRQEIINL